MSRAFWVAVGAVGGIIAYKKSTQAAERARELGPMGTAQATAEATSRIAGRTAHGLGRLTEIRDRRAGRLVIGSAEVVGSEDLPGDPTEVVPGDRPAGTIPEGWVPVPPTVVLGVEDGVPASSATAPTPRPSTTAGSTPRVRRARHD